MPGISTSLAITKGQPLPLLGQLASCQLNLTVFLKGSCPMNIKIKKLLHLTVLYSL